MRQAVARQQQQHAVQTPGADRILEAVAAASPAGLVVLDAAGAVVLWNAAAERAFGWPAAQVLGRLLPIIAPDEARRLAAEMAGQAAPGDGGGSPDPDPLVRRLVCLRRDGAEIEASLTATVIRDDHGRAVGSALVLSPLLSAVPGPGARVGSDATGGHDGAAGSHEGTAGVAEVGEAAGDEPGSYRLEALARFAAGVAHDVNNVLTAIAGYADLLAADLPADVPAQADVAEIRSAADRATRLMRQLLTFGRRQHLRPEPLEIDEVITGIESMLRRLAGRSVNLIVMRSANGAIVEADRAQLEQVLTNLVVNARDAMPDGGQLHIATAILELDDAFVARHPGSRPGPHVRIAVRDSGHGMDRTTLAHLFEPYYTTKPAGKGTGLGLAIVYGAVKQSNGYIVAQSAPGAGTAMTIYLPRR